LIEIGWHVDTPEVKLKSGDVGSGFCFVVGQMLTLIQDQIQFLCLIQDQYLFVLNQQLIDVFFQCEILFLILRKNAPAQQFILSQCRKHTLHHEKIATPTPFYLLAYAQQPLAKFDFFPWKVMFSPVAC
jgi:hypothetical protein